MLIPPSVSLTANLQHASQRWSLRWFCRMVRRHGPWDFRMQAECYRAFGNFHYGAVATAMGFPMWLTLRAAGWEHWWTGRSRPGWGRPWGGWSYGDDPEDSLNILLGIAKAKAMGYRTYLWSRLGWRAFDVACATAILLLTSPLLVILALLVLLTSGRPVFDGSWRLGRYGRWFRCWKLRTLRRDHEAILEKHLKDNPVALWQWANFKKLPDDPRATRLGRFLRKTSLDDLLAQPWNILVGDMAVFGPRPFLVSEDLGEYRDVILSVTPGWVSYYGGFGRATMPFQERLKVEAKYASRMHKVTVRWRALAGTVWHCGKGTGA